MMLPLDELDGHEVEPYDIPRSTCPRCGSGDIRRLLIGRPTGPHPMNSTPDWVARVGCVHLGYDRERDDCGLAWSNADPSRPVVPPERRSPGIEHKNVMPAAPPCPQTAVPTTLARRGNA